MDEIDWMKAHKKALVFISKIFMGIAMFFLAVAIIVNIIKNNWDNIGSVLLAFISIGIIPPIILSITYIAMDITVKIINSGRKVINFDENYIRELPKKYSPAISSLIYDLKIDVYKDYTATILYLCINKYINLVKNGDTYKMEIGKQKDFSKLGRCEKYVLDILTNNKEFDETQFKQEIIQEAQEKLLITDKKYSKKTKIAILLLFAITLLIITYNISKMIFVILFIIFGTIILASLIIYRVVIESDVNINIILDDQYIRTKKGEEVANTLKGIKNYIKEYTLIKEKNIDYIHTLEDYIPYAISLDEADTIEEFIKHNEEYRDLIYNIKIDKS